MVRDKIYYLGLENQSNSMTSLSNALRTSTASDNSGVRRPGNAATLNSRECEVVYLLSSQVMFNLYCTRTHR